MDGTLLNTEPLGCKAVYLTVKEYISKEARQGFKERNYQMEWVLKQQTLGLPDDKWVPIVLQWATEHWGMNHQFLSVNEFVKEWDKYMYDNMSNVDLCTGASKVVEELHNMGLPLAIATSSKAIAVKKKRVNHETKIFNKITEIVTTDDPTIKRGKPFPDIYLEAAKRLQVQPQNCIVFEDGLTGVKSGYDADCYVVAIPDQRTSLEELEQFYKAGADLILKDLTQFNINDIVDES